MVALAGGWHHCQLNKAAHSIKSQSPNTCQEPSSHSWCRQRGSCSWLMATSALDPTLLDWMMPLRPEALTRAVQGDQTDALIMQRAAKAAALIDTPLLIYPANSRVL